MNPHKFGTEMWLEHEMCKEPEHRDPRTDRVLMRLAFPDDIEEADAVADIMGDLF